MKIENTEDKKEKENEIKAPWWQPSILLFARLSGWIVGPIIIAVFIGSWLDKKYEKEPWLFLLSVGVAFVISTFGLFKNAIEYMIKIEKENTKKNDRRNRQPDNK